MATHDLIKLFDGTKIRVVWDDKQEKYYFSVVDVVSVLTDSVNPTDYLKKMRKRDPELAEGWGQIVTPPYLSNDGRSSEIEFCGYAIYPPHHTIYPVQESRANQAMVGTSGK